MENEDKSRPRENERFKLETEIHGMISAARVCPWIQRFWRATGDLVLLRELLEWEVQERPQVKRVLERVIELGGKLVTAHTIVEEVKTL